MPGLMKRALVLAKTETNEAVDAVPTAAANSLLVSNLSVRNVGEEIERDIILDNFSRLGFVVGVSYGELGFQTELRNIQTQITAAVPLRENPLYLAAGLSPTYAASSVIYQPRSDWGAVVNSATLYFYLDGLLHVFLGARANVALDGTVGQYGRLNWTLQGVFAQINAAPTGSDGVRDATIASAGAPTYQAFTVKPPPLLSASLSMHGFTTARVNQITFDMGNELVRRDDMTAANGIASILINGRSPQGTMNPEQETRATHDFWSRWINGTEGAIVWTFGTGSDGQWRRIRVNIPAGQYKQPTPGDRNGIRIYDMGYTANRVAAGDDEVQFIYM